MKHNTETLGRLLSCEGIPELTSIKMNGGNARASAKYFSPLQNILRQVGEQITDLRTQEVIPPFVAPPWWQGPKIVIEGGDAARARHDRVSSDHTTMCLYTDGSSTDGHVGAAAVHPVKRQTSSSYMGTDATSTVYAAELQGLVLALDIARRETRLDNMSRQIAIFTDNQAAIRSTTRPEGRSAAYIVKVIAELVDALHSQGHQITIRWIPSHEGIAGNEAADIAAKEATGWRNDGTRGTTAEKPTQLRPLRSTLKTRCQKKANEQWRARWKSETRGRVAYRYAPVPSKKVLELHSGRTKSESAVLVQLRTEKIGLNDFLFRRKVPGILDPMCPCGHGRQTVRHVLLACRRHTDLRKQHLSRFPGHTNLRAILTKRKLATKAIKFIELTQILGQSRITRE